MLYMSLAVLYLPYALLLNGGLVLLIRLGGLCRNEGRKLASRCLVLSVAEAMLFPAGLLVVEWIPRTKISDLALWSWAGIAWIGITASLVRKLPPVSDCHISWPLALTCAVLAELPHAYIALYVYAYGSARFV